MRNRSRNEAGRVRVLSVVCSGLLSWPMMATAANLHAADHHAADHQAADLLPKSCVLYAKLAEPGELVSLILNHPLRAELESHKAWQAAVQSQPYRNFLTGRKFFEVQMGMDWHEAVTALSAGGIHVAFDSTTQGAVLLVRARDAETLQTFQSKILELVRLGKSAEDATDEYRGITVYKLDQGAAAIVRDWLVVVNKGDLGKGILDRLLDDSVDRSQSQDVLSQNPRFQQAQARQDQLPTVWGFADLEVIRGEDKVARALDEQAENPLAEMLAGGIQSTLQQTPWITAEISVTATELGLSVQMPFSEDWIPEERSHFFGREPEGHAPLLPQVPETALSLATWRDVSEMWLRAGDLFDENTNDQLANADSTLTTLFAGRDFAEDILGSFRPQMGLVVVRQDYANITPQPAIKLPAFALILEMRDAERMTRELRRTFQSMIGFFNVVGAMEGRPQLEMDMRKLDAGELVTSSYIPEDDDRQSTTADIIFNFSPSVGFVESRFVVSSTAQLAEQLIQAKVPEADGALQPNTRLTLSAPVVQQMLDDNREQLIAQNMLEEGRSRDEAETQIDLLLQLIGYFHSLDMHLAGQDGWLDLGLTVSLRK